MYKDELKRGAEHVAGKTHCLVDGRGRCCSKVSIKSCRCACASVHEMVFMAHEMYIACMYHVYNTIYITLLYNLKAFVNALKLNP